MDEVWKDVDGLEGLYQVSSYGRIKSFRKSNHFFGQQEHYLKPFIKPNGYESVTLYDSEHRRYRYLVHRLVAIAFIPNPLGYDAVNHKDENKRNNHVENLEWCTSAYNNAYGTARIRQRLTRGRKIEQLTLEGFPLAVYNSVSIASELTGISKAGINNCCSGKSALSGGYVWRYV